MRPEEKHPRPPRWPVWAIIGVGSVATVIALIWAGATYDDHGKALIDGPMSVVLAATIPALLTTAAAFGARSLGQIKHEVKNSHGTNLRADMDALIIGVEKLNHAQHETAQSLAALRSVPSEIKGIRESVNIQATADQQTHTDIAQLRSEFASHIRWSQDWTESQSARIDRLENP